MQDAHKAVLQGKHIALTRNPERLETKKQALFSFKKCNNKEVVTAFTGLLELSRRSKVITEQEEIFGNIEVEKIKKRKV